MLLTTFSIAFHVWTMPVMLSTCFPMLACLNFASLSEHVSRLQSWIENWFECLVGSKSCRRLIGNNLSCNDDKTSMVHSYDQKTKTGDHWESDHHFNVSVFVFLHTNSHHCIVFGAVIFLHVLMLCYKFLSKLTNSWASHLIFFGLYTIGDTR